MSTWKNSSHLTCCLLVILLSFGIRQRGHVSAATLRNQHGYGYANRPLGAGSNTLSGGGNNGIEFNQQSQHNNQHQYLQTQPGGNMQPGHVDPSSLLELNAAAMPIMGGAQLQSQSQSNSFFGARPPSQQPPQKPIPEPPQPPSLIENLPLQEIPPVPPVPSPPQEQLQSSEAQNSPPHQENSQQVPQSEIEEQQQVFEQSQVPTEEQQVFQQEQTSPQEELQESFESVQEVPVSPPEPVAIQEQPPHPEPAPAPTFTMVPEKPIGAFSSNTFSVFNQPSSPQEDSQLSVGEQDSPVSVFDKPMSSLMPQLSESQVLANTISLFNNQAQQQPEAPQAEVLSEQETLSQEPLPPPLLSGSAGWTPQSGLPGSSLIMDTALSITSAAAVSSTHAEAINLIGDSESPAVAEVQFGSNSHHGLIGDTTQQSSGSDSGTQSSQGHVEGGSSQMYELATMADHNEIMLTGQSNTEAIGTVLQQSLSDTINGQGEFSAPQHLDIEHETIQQAIEQQQQPEYIAPAVTVEEIPQHFQNEPQTVEIEPVVIMVPAIEHETPVSISEAHSSSHQSSQQDISPPEVLSTAEITSSFSNNVPMEAVSLSHALINQAQVGNAISETSMLQIAKPPSRRVSRMLDLDPKEMTNAIFRYRLLSIPDPAEHVLSEQNGLNAAVQQ